MSQANGSKNESSVAFEVQKSSTATLPNKVKHRVSISTLPSNNGLDFQRENLQIPARQDSVNETNSKTSLHKIDVDELDEEENSAPEEEENDDEEPNVDTSNPLLNSSSNSESNNEVSQEDSNPSIHENPLMGKKFSIRSNQSYSSINGSSDDTVGKLLNESALSKLQFMKYFFFALAMIAVTFSICREMSEGFGIPLNLGGNFPEGFASVIFGLILMATHVVCVFSLEKALIVLVGLLLARKHGIGCSIVGAVQGSFVDQVLTFSNLSARSKIRTKFLLIVFSKICQNLLVFLIPFIFSNLYTDKQSVVGNPLSCIEYNQLGIQKDRGWPDLNVAMGVGEYAVGTSVGILRAEEKVQTTQFYSPPQLIDVADDGTRIFGNGQIASITSYCLCSASGKSADLGNVGVDSAIAGDLEANIKSLGFEPGMANFITSNSTSVNLQTALTISSICGGDGIEVQPVAVCFTSIYDIRHAVIEVEYMTDGNPASIATKRTKLKSVGSNADIKWLYNGYKYLFGGDLSHKFLPANSPNSLNSLLTWGTDSAQQINAARLSEGVEAMFAIITKAAIQRSFNLKGSRCPQIIKDKSKQVALLREESSVYYSIFLGAELLFVLFSGIVLFLWLIYRFPIIPAIRFASEKSYFMVLLCKSSFSKQLYLLRGIYNESEFWAKLDHTARIGESRNTVDDSESGAILLGPPKMVHDFSWNKAYK